MRVFIVSMCLRTHAGVQTRFIQRGVALSVHLSSLERYHSATPVAVGALCPPQCVALLSTHPSSSSPPSSFHLSSSSQLPPQLCPLATGPLLGACPVYLTQFEPQSHPHANTRDAHEYCMCADTLKRGCTLDEVTQTRTHTVPSTVSLLK